MRAADPHRTRRSVHRIADQPARVPRQTLRGVVPPVATALAPQRASAYTDTSCGHTFTTGECPHPFGVSRGTDVFGYPVHPIYL